MNRPEVILATVALFAWLIGMGWCHNATCPDCQTAAAAVPPVPVETADLSLTIADDDLNFSTTANDNLLFAAGACDYQSDFSDGLTQAFQRTVEHLRENPRRILTLTGLYETAESNQCTDYTDLGVARAERVKSLLIDMGAPAEQIELEASLTTDLAEYNGLNVEGVRYDFRETEVSEAAALQMDNITLYFDTNKQNIELSDSQRRYLERLKAYLAQNADAKATVYGYTDDRGEDRYNMRLSRKRSEFVRDFLIKQGVSRRQIENKGYGPDDPIATNSTEEGRAKNRRVEISLK